MQPELTGADRALRIAVINSIVEFRDAISANVVDHANILEELGHEVCVFSYNCDYRELAFKIVGCSSDLYLDEFFLSADIILWHFGIYYPIFDLVQIGNGSAKQIVCFHNITPPEFVAEKNRETIERSIQQAHLLGFADEVWGDSEINAQASATFGADASRVVVLPLIVNSPTRTKLAQKHGGQINILYVGRFTKAKGVLDLLKAVISMPADLQRNVNVTLAGNIAFSDPAYLLELRDLSEDDRLIASITIAESPDDEKLHELYAEAHILAIPSFHEGFCKPVIEGLRSGCIPWGYSSYNLPYVAHGLGRLVQPGDICALSKAGAELIKALLAAGDNLAEAVLPLDREATATREFDQLAENYTATFETPQVRNLMRERIANLIDATYKPLEAKETNVC